MCFAQGQQNMTMGMPGTGQTNPYYASPSAGPPVPEKTAAPAAPADTGADSTVDPEAKAYERPAKTSIAEARR